MESSESVQYGHALSSVVEDEKPKGKKIVYLYSVDEAKQALSGLTVITNNKATEQQKKPLQPITAEPEALMAVPSLSKMCCSACAVSFDNRTDLIGHFKCDFHRFNVRTKLRGLSPVSEEAFEEIAGGDISSISGSDSDESSDSDDEGWASLSASITQDVDKCEDEPLSSYSRRERIFFRNATGELISLHRCLVFGKKNQLSSSLDVLNAVSSLTSSHKWAIFMAGGGHFAGALFDGDQVLQHKTFHRYVVRAKRGTAQSQRDKHGHAPRSAGATLRRHNESALTQEIQELITSWSSEIKDCAKIFLRAPGFNKAIFFGGNNPVFSKSDPRIHAISIRTRRPTFYELKRVHRALSSIEVYGPNCSVDDCVIPKRPSTVTEHLPQPERNSEMTETQSTTSRKKPATPRSLETNTETPKAGESGDDSSGSGFDQLTWDAVTSETSVLKAFECTKRPRRKKKTSDNKKKAAEEGNLLCAEQLEIRNRIFTACKTGDVDTFQSALDSLCISLRQITSVNSVCESVLKQISDTQSNSDIHVDQSTCLNQNDGPAPQTESLQEDSVSTNDADFKKTLSEFLSQRFGPQLTTLLHVATISGHKSIMNLLMTHGADPAVRDAQDQVPYLAATSKDTKNEFRRFMAGNPTKYDYLKAQIPGPLTEEMENNRKAKAMEKKKLQQKAKKEKIKEAELEEERRNAEEKERQAFLAMNDREKRAHAAEQRFKKQLEEENSAKNAVLVRCWECGRDLTGIVPFEYYDYKFCSPSCLKEHRLKSATKS